MSILALNQCFESVVRRLRQNKLELNPCRTMLMLIRKADVLVDGVEMAFAKHIKSLRVLMDLAFHLKNTVV